MIEVAIRLPWESGHNILGLQDQKRPEPVILVQTSSSKKTCSLAFREFPLADYLSLIALFQIRPLMVKPS